MLAWAKWTKWVVAAAVTGMIGNGAYEHLLKPLVNRTSVSAKPTGGHYVVDSYDPGYYVTDSYNPGFYTKKK